MKTTNYILQIPKPCKENWDEMTTIERGKHCTVCNKNVIDFSVITDTEIDKILTSLNQNICGRFYENQLNRELIYHKKTNLFWNLEKGITALFFISFGSKSFAQTNNIKSSIINNTVKVNCKRPIIGQIKESADSTNTNKRTYRKKENDTMQLSGGHSTGTIFLIDGQVIKNDKPIQKKKWYQFWKNQSLNTKL